MTSTIFTRCAMLSGGTLLGIGALLAACGQQANIIHFYPTINF